MLKLYSDKRQHYQRTEFKLTMINMLTALMGKAGNMQEQIDNVKGETLRKNQEEIPLLIFEFNPITVEPLIPILYAMIILEKVTSTKLS